MSLHRSKCRHAESASRRRAYGWYAQMFAEDKSERSRAGTLVFRPYGSGRGVSLMVALATDG
jgi:hypothetical protein